jgi:hypothetical protein
VCGARRGTPGYFDFVHFSKVCVSAGKMAFYRAFAAY